jgi:hypothetical protein
MGSAPVLLGAERLGFRMRGMPGCLHVVRGRTRAVQPGHVLVTACDRVLVPSAMMPGPPDVVLLRFVVVGRLGFVPRG